ncbi:hypothetical protein ACTXG6_40370 [Pseudonocardia sp. Cha107L01]|uniref:hypothetical protein n=1 Tax=Pseudonocardia sp. Cha107L01 TaxID=3457576 RepID=UPI00403E84A0
MTDTGQLTDPAALEQQIGARRHHHTARVSSLRARLTELAAAARDHVRAGRFDEAEAAAAEQQAVKAELVPAEASAHLLEEIHTEASAARQRRDWERQVVEAEARRDAELEAARAIVTRIEALFNECRETVRQGFAHEANAREAAGTAWQLREVLNPTPEVGGMISPNPMPRVPTPVTNKINTNAEWWQFFDSIPHY